MARTGVLLMGFGGPDSLDAVGPFCTNLMGREPAPDALERIKSRYVAIGGSSPLPVIAGRIAARLEQRLSRGGERVPVLVGMRYWDPYIADGLAALVADGCDRVVAVSLSPFESPASSGGYRKALAEAAAGFPALTVVEATSFRETPAFIGALAEALAEAVRELPAGLRRAVLFTAHSLPASELDGSGYVEELRECAAEVAESAALDPPAPGGEERWLPAVEAFGSANGEPPWLFAYQSKGLRPGDWLGPDIADVLRSLAGSGYEAVAVAPIGFATDHMETLYDLDVDAAGLALGLGLEFVRAAVPNDSDRMVEALADVVEPLLPE